MFRDPHRTIGRYSRRQRCTENRLFEMCGDGLRSCALERDRGETPSFRRILAGDQSVRHIVPITSPTLIAVSEREAVAGIIGQLAGERRRRCAAMRSSRFGCVCRQRVLNRPPYQNPRLCP
ncbi:MAG: hypothetical protein AAF360_07550, partial [Pseudomonadota bacterium]